MKESSAALVIYYDGTFVNLENGAHSRMTDLLSFARGMAARVIVYSYRNHPSCPWGEAEIARFQAQFPDVDLVLDHKPRWFSLLIKLKLMLIMLFPVLAAQIIKLSIPFVTPGWKVLRAEGAGDVLLVNYFSGMAELNGRLGREVWVETHDLNFVNCSKARGQKITGLKYMLKARGEIELLSQASALISISQPETGFFNLLFSKLPVFFIPSYFSKRAIPTADRVTDRYDLVFLGSENIHNVNGLCDFLSSHAQWLSHYRLGIAGRICNVERVRSAVQGLKGVDLVGYIDDAQAFIRSGKIVISPVDGTGLKIKILDALGAGRAVFGSAHSLEGLPGGYENCVFPLTTAGMQAMLENQVLRKKAETAALTYAAQLDQAGDLTAFAVLLKQVLKKPSPVRMPKLVGAMWYENIVPVMSLLFANVGVL